GLRNGEGFAELTGDVDGTGHLFAHHGRLDRSLGGLADCERSVVLHQYRWRAMITKGLHDPATDRVVANQGERADRDLPTELVAHHGQNAGNGFSARSPGGGGGRVRVDHTADLGHVLV